MIGIERERAYGNISSTIEIIPSDAEFLDCVEKFTLNIHSSVKRRLVELAPTIMVLVGYVKKEEHYKWISGKGLYNIRLIKGEEYDRRFSSADYILLHRQGEAETCDLRRLKKNSFKIMSRDDIELMDYPVPGHYLYMVYEVESENNSSVKSLTVDITRLQNYRSGHASARPFTSTLLEMMRAIHN